MWVSVCAAAPLSSVPCKHAFEAVLEHHVCEAVDLHALPACQLHHLLHLIQARLQDATHVSTSTADTQSGSADRHSTLQQMQATLLERHSTNMFRAQIVSHVVQSTEQQLRWCAAHPVSLEAVSTCRSLGNCLAAEQLVDGLVAPPALPHSRCPARMRRCRRCGRARPSLWPGRRRTSWPCGSGAQRPSPGPCGCRVGVGMGTDQHDTTSGDTDRKL